MFPQSFEFYYCSLFLQDIIHFQTELTPLHWFSELTNGSEIVWPDSNMGYIHGNQTSFKNEQSWLSLFPTCYIPYLGHHVELHHGIGEWVCVGFQWRHQPQHGTVEGAVDLLQWHLTWVVHIHHGHMTEKSGKEEIEYYSIPSAKAAKWHMNLQSYIQFTPEKWLLTGYQGMFKIGEEKKRLTQHFHSFNKRLRQEFCI